jgi:hypothetical protein
MRFGSVVHEDKISWPTRGPNVASTTQPCGAGWAVWRKVPANEVVRRSSSPTVAALDSACHAGGRRFESRRPWPTARAGVRTYFGSVLRPPRAWKLTPVNRDSLMWRIPHSRGGCSISAPSRDRWRRRRLPRSCALQPLVQGRRGGDAVESALALDRLLQLLDERAAERVFEPRQGCPYGLRPHRQCCDLA